MSHTDSTPWRPVLEHVLRSLASDIVRAAGDTVSRPWRITLPDSTPEWRTFRAHLERVLRARPPREGERALDELSIGAMRTSGDSVFVALMRRHTKECPGGVGVTGYGNREEVHVVRLRSGVWSAARSPYVSHGDLAGCRPPEAANDGRRIAAPPPRG